MEIPEMVERVMRALYDADPFRESYEEHLKIEPVEALLLEQKARAAIKAMRDFDQAMCAAATVKIFTIAYLPEALAQAWLQHLRDFDQAHPGCHFEIAADAPEMSLAAMVEAVRIEPELSFSEIIERRRKR